MGMFCPLRLVFRTNCRLQLSAETKGDCLDRVNEDSRLATNRCALVFVKGVMLSSVTLTALCCFNSSLM